MGCTVLNGFVLFIRPDTVLAGRLFQGTVVGAVTCVCDGPGGKPRL
jgi:hypothetical protein